MDKVLAALLKTMGFNTQFNDKIKYVQPLMVVDVHKSTGVMQTARFKVLEDWSLEPFDVQLISKTTKANYVRDLRLKCQEQKEIAHLTGMTMSTVGNLMHKINHENDNTEEGKNEHR